MLSRVRPEIWEYALAAVACAALAYPAAQGYGPAMLIGAVGVAVVASVVAWGGRVGLPVVTVLFVPTLLGLPALFADHSETASGAVAAGLALVALSAVGRRVVSLRVWAPLVGLFFALVLVACLRVEAWGTLALWGGFFAFSAAAFLTADEDEARRLRFAVILSPAVFAAINVGLSLVGVEQERTLGESGPAELLQGLGLTAERELFPLVYGYADFGTPAALGLIGALMLLRHARSWLERAALVALIPACLYGLLLADTRAALVAAVIALVVVVAFAPRVGRGFGLIALTIPVTSLIAVAAVSVVAESEQVLEFTREGTRPETLTGRTFLWEKVEDRLSEPQVDDLLGFGLYGTAEDGVSDEYFVDLPANVDATQGSAHNFGFQTIFDLGYLGLAVVVVIFGLTIAALGAEYRRPTSAAMLAMLVLMLVAGATETTPSVYTPQAFAVFVGIVLLSVRSAVALREDVVNVDVS